MNGEQLKKKLDLAGYRVYNKDFTLKIGMNANNIDKILNSSDIKTSELEKIAEQLSLPLEYFFKDDKNGKQSLGDIVVTRDPFYIKESQYELKIKLEEGESLKYLAIVSIHCTEKHGRNISVFPLEKYHKFNWNDPGGDGTIFFLFKKNGEGIIRFFDKNHNLHDQFIGENGYRITLDNMNGPRLCLYEGINLITSKYYTFDTFEDSFLDVWQKYSNEEKE